jgi:uncharacterized membrane protein
MPDETNTPPPVPPAVPPPTSTPAEIESGKMMAILSYLPVGPVGLIIAIINVVQKNNAFALYHAKQALTLYIFALGLYIISIPLMFICIGIPLMIAAGVGGLVFCILGIMNANSAQYKPLPYIGQFADKWFGKIQKV